jgi:hypothetical protein
MRVVVTMHSFQGEPALAPRTLDSLGLPLFDVFTARSGDREISYLMAGDEQEALASAV